MINDVRSELRPHCNLGLVKTRPGHLNFMNTANHMKSLEPPAGSNRRRADYELKIGLSKDLRDIRAQSFTRRGCSRSSWKCEGLATLRTETHLDLRLLYGLSARRNPSDSSGRRWISSDVRSGWNRGMPLESDQLGSFTASEPVSGTWSGRVFRRKWPC